jgi:hypothetical protein
MMPYQNPALEFPLWVKAFRAGGVFFGILFIAVSCYHPWAKDAKIPFLGWLVIAAIVLPLVAPWRLIDSLAMQRILLLSLGAFTFFFVLITIKVLFRHPLNTPNLVSWTVQSLLMGIQLPAVSAIRRMRRNVEGRTPE